MNPLIVVTGVCLKDIDLAQTQYEWLADLGGCKSHHCLLVVDSQVPATKRDLLLATARRSFASAVWIPVEPTNGWMPNHAFLAAAKQVDACFKLAWLWMEPDCVPLDKAWLDKLSFEYHCSPFKYVGPLVRQAGQASLPAVHLTGTAVYPCDAWQIYRQMPKLLTDNVAWDIETAGAIVPRAGDTKLIRHWWGSDTMPPVFVKQRQANSPSNHVELPFSGVQDGAVLFHRSKDGGLITLMREKLKLPVKKVEVVGAKIALEEIGAVKA